VIKFIPVACPESVVLSGCSGYFTTKTGRHDIAEILLKVALKHQKKILIEDAIVTRNQQIVAIMRNA
jgi:hypothetical protein